MIDFVIAFKANIPFIGVHTDDPVNLKPVLKALTGKTAQVFPLGPKVPIGNGYVWFSDSLDAVTTENYKKLVDHGAVCVVVNPDKPSMLVLDVGVLPTPENFYTEYLLEFAEESVIPSLVAVLRGLSLKGATEVVQLTMARTGGLLPKEVRKTRQMLRGQHPGLSELETDYDFYDWPKPLKEWLDLNDKYFLDPSTPEKLVPRGLLLAGEAGVGKSMASMVLAKHWDVPLLRLDVATSLNRWLGESEGRIAQSLSIIEHSAPCVWLLDEVEKLFTGDTEGTPQRILSQILWWLQHHKSRVLTVMTTNDKSKIPPELYRSERLDRVITIDKLSLSEAKQFASRVYAATLGKMPSSQRVKLIKERMDLADKGMWAHADVRVFVYELIKQNHWVSEG